MSTSESESKYIDLLKEARAAWEQFGLKASEYIPKMYFALRNEGLTAFQSRSRIELDCADFWGERIIRQYMPEEAKHKQMRRKPKPSLREQIAAVSAANSVSASECKEDDQVSNRARATVVDGIPVRNDNSTYPQTDGQIILPWKLAVGISALTYHNQGVAIVLTVKDSVVVSLEAQRDSLSKTIKDESKAVTTSGRSEAVSGVA